MRIFDNLQQLPSFQRAAVTIGTFDGVHLGHQKIIADLNHIAQQQQGESVLITFHPHPRQVLQTDIHLQLLNTLDEKTQRLAHLGLQNIVVVPFTREFSQQEPQYYISDFLVHHFNPKTIVIGYDHYFGRQRAGNIQLLQQYAPLYGYQVKEIPQQLIDNAEISSTLIRNALLAGKPETATQLLGYRYTLSGEVIKGRQLGRTIGFPTANIQPNSPDKLVPALGVYAVWLHHAAKRYPAMLNIGKRPTVNNEDAQTTIEVHILGFNSDIYGETLTIEFCRFLRPEQKFATLADLTAQLERDAEATLAHLATEQ